MGFFSPFALSDKVTKYMWNSIAYITSWSL
jgi:hypothetical protein